MFDFYNYYTYLYLSGTPSALTSWWALKTHQIISNCRLKLAQILPVQIFRGSCLGTRYECGRLSGSSNSRPWLSSSPHWLSDKVKRNKLGWFFLIDESASKNLKGRKQNWHQNISFLLPYRRQPMGWVQKSWTTITESTQPSTFIVSTKARTSEYLNWKDLCEFSPAIKNNLVGFMCSPAC